MFPVEQSGKCQMVAISNTTGNINWCKAEDVEVVSVDGKSLSDILTGYANISDEFIGVPLLESADDVKDDFRYQEFITEDPERLSIYSDDLVERFNRWLEIKNTY